MARSIIVLANECRSLIGVSADVISAGVEADAGIVKTKDGKTKIEFDAEAGVGWFGWGLVFGVTLPF